ncbi:hypothetical protein D3C71_2044460 [compost metagenome]
MSTQCDNTITHLQITRHAHAGLIIQAANLDRTPCHLLRFPAHHPDPRAFTGVVEGPHGHL